MLELIVSIGVIVASVVSILGLVIATTTTSDASKAQILATNLAREGVEIARSIRDNNWLALDVSVPNTAWNKSLYHESEVPPGQFDFTAIASFQPPTPPTGGTWALHFNEDALGDPRTEFYFHPVRGIYTQVENTGGCPGGPFCCELPNPGPMCNFQPIQYWRILHLNPICWPDGGPTETYPEQILGDSESFASGGDPCQLKYPVAPYTQVGIQIRSRVRWLEHGKVSAVEVNDKLFNWKP